MVSNLHQLLSGRDTRGKYPTYGVNGDQVSRNSRNRRTARDQRFQAANRLTSGACPDDRPAVSDRSTDEEYPRRRGFYPRDAPRDRESCPWLRHWLSPRRVHRHAHACNRGLAAACRLSGRYDLSHRRPAAALVFSRTFRRNPFSPAKIFLSGSPPRLASPRVRRAMSNVHRGRARSVPTGPSTKK